MPAGGKIKYSQEFISLLADQYAAGATYRHLASMYNLHPTCVGRLLRRYRKEVGQCSKPSRSYFLTNRRHASREFGDFRGMVQGLDSRIGRWLEDQTPRDGTICGSIESIIKEAYKGRDKG